MDLSKNDEKKILKELIEKTKVEVFVSGLKIRYWQRKVVLGGLREEENLARQTMSGEGVKNWLEFLEEIEKEK